MKKYEMYSHRDEVTFDQALVYHDLMARYGDRIAAICVSHANDDVDAETLFLAVDDVVWRSMRSFPRGMDRYCTSRWVFTVVRNAVADCMRRAARHETLDEQMSDPDEQDREAHELLADLMADLPDHDRELLQAVLDGFTACELAEREGVSYAAIRQRMHRIKQKLITIKKRKYD